MSPLDEMGDQIVTETLVDIDLEVEPDDEVFHDIDHPWDPEDIRVSTRNFSLRNVIDMIAERGSTSRRISNDSTFGNRYRRSN